MAANVAVAQDPAGNLKPAKDKCTERIDGIVALIMAIGRAHGRPGGAAARVLHVLCVKGEDATTLWDTEREAMTGLNYFCLVGLRLPGAALARPGQRSRPNRSAEPSLNAALHSSAQPVRCRVLFRARQG